MTTLETIAVARRRARRLADRRALAGSACPRCTGSSGRSSTSATCGRSRRGCTRSARGCCCSPTARRRRCAARPSATWRASSTSSARRPTSRCSTAARWRTSRRCRRGTPCGCSPRSASASCRTARRSARRCCSRSPPEQVRVLLERNGMPRRTDMTITDPDAFLEHLAAAAADGYALDDGEQEVGVRCVAVPVRGRPGPAGAVGLRAGAAHDARARAARRPRCSGRSPRSSPPTSPERACGSPIPGQCRVLGRTVLSMPQLRIGEAASLLGCQRRHAAPLGRAGAARSSAGRASGGAVVDGAELARVALELAEGTPPAGGARSARNSLRGIVTKVTRDTVMAQVELQAGPHRIVSLMSREAADELALDVGVRGRTRPSRPRTSSSASTTPGRASVRRPSAALAGGGCSAWSRPAARAAVRRPAAPTTTPRRPARSRSSPRRRSPRSSRRSRASSRPTSRARP